jgi:dipeptidyl aminopeptidase/acylaminoacyl peptidase
MTQRAKPVTDTSAPKVVARFSALVVSLLMFSLMLAACGIEQAPAPGEWQLAFADLDVQRIAVCRLNGSHVRYITPDSLVTLQPSADSTGHIIIFAATRRQAPQGASALYSIQSDGTGLELLTYAPFHISEVSAGPDGSMALFVGRYADSDMPRVYRYRRGEEGFSAVLGPERVPTDLAMAPTGANFLFHDGSAGDTMWVGNVAGGLPIPIYNFPYSQCSFAPDGLSLVTVDRGARNTLALFDFRDWTADTMVAPEDGSTVADPAVHPDGQKACFVRKSAAAGEVRLAIADLNSHEIKILREVARRPARPVWVR